MTDAALYERYKDALRRGHVAALRSRLDAAVLAYTEAAELAPDRPLPHASLGGVLLRLERPAEALAAYDAALARSSADEAALGGRAQALATLGRRVDAADALDILAGIQEASGRLPEACDTARRALELAESRERRRHVEALAQRLRDVPADAAAAAALERALGMLEPVARVPEPEAQTPAEATQPLSEQEAVTPEVAAEPRDDAPEEEPVHDRAAAAEPEAAQPEPEPEPEPAHHERELEPEAAQPERELEPEPEPELEPEPEPELEPEPAPEPEPEPAPQLAAEAVRLSEEAAARIEAGDTDAARDALVAAAAAHRSAGNPNAALDACYLALEIAPADAALHLLLAQLYIDRGWQGHAGEKLRLLDRMTELSGDGSARAEVRQLVAALADAADEVAPTT